MISQRHGGMLLALVVATVVAAPLLLRAHPPAHGDATNHLYLPLALRLAAPAVATAVPSATASPETPAMPVPTQTEEPVPSPEVVAQLGGTAYAVAKVGDYVYVAEGAAVTAYDVRDPTAPTVVGRGPTLPGRVLGLATHGDYLLAAVSAGYAIEPIGAGLAVLGLAEPTQPDLVTMVPLADGANDVVVAGDYAYVAGGDVDAVDNPSSQMIVFDVSDPGLPRRVASRTLTGRASRSIVYAAGHVYVAHPASRMASIIDVTTPDHPLYVGSLTATWMWGFGDLATDGDRLAGLDHTVGAGAIVAFDLSRPAEPTLIGRALCKPDTSSPWPRVAGIAFLGEQLLAVGNDRVCTIAIGDLNPNETLHEVPSVPLPFSGATLVVEGRRAYVAANWGDPLEGDYLGAWFMRGGLAVLDLDEPTGPAIVAAVPGASGLPATAAVVDDWLLIGDGHANMGVSPPQLQVFDAADRRHPVPAAALDLPDWPHGTAAVGDTLFMVTEDGLLLTLDVGDPEEPALVGSSPLGWAPFGPLSMFHYDGYLYAVDFWNQSCLIVVDVRDPSQPTTRPDCSMSAITIATDGAGILVTVDGEAMSTYDLSLPGAPRRLGRLDLDDFGLGSPQYVAVDGTLAVVTTVHPGGYGGGLFTVDVTNPSVLRVLGQMANLLSPSAPLQTILQFQPVLVEGHAVLSNPFGYILSVDLTDPRRPRASGPPTQLPFTAALSQFGDHLGPDGLAIAAWGEYVVLPKTSGVSIVRP